MLTTVFYFQITDMPSGSNDENEVKSQLDLGEPPQHVLDWAKENIRENPETRDQVIEEFRDMIFGKSFRLNRIPNYYKSTRNNLRIFDPNCL